MVRSFQGRLALISAMIAFQPVFADSNLQSTAQPIKVCGGYFPNSTMQIPIGTFQAMGVSRARYDWVLDKMEQIYSSKIAAMGGKYVINRMWTTNEVNASAERYGNQYIINMYGGLARHPLLTEEAFALVACHETGHHLGGAPKIFGDWASNEGESDYYSTLKCLRYFYENEDNETWIQTAQVDSFAVQRCTAQFPLRNDQLICLRASAGAMSIAAVFQDLDQDSNHAMFSTPDTRVVSRMDDDHPMTQCRVDTLFNGATCTKNKSEPLDDKNPSAGACVQGVDTYGWRPLCWFRP